MPARLEWEVRAPRAECDGDGSDIGDANSPPALAVGGGGSFMPRLLGLLSHGQNLIF